MKVKITNRQPRFLGTCTGHRLVPGVNVLDMTEAQFNTLRQDAGFQSWQKLGWAAFVQDQAPIAEGEVPVEVPEAADLSAALEGKNLVDAKLMIAATTDLELLATWHEKDARKGVRQAIEARIVELEKPEGESTEDTEE